MKPYKYFIYFLFSTIIGTLSHEFGHYVTAKALGYEAFISYKSTQWKNADDTPLVFTKESPKSVLLDYILVTLGGPLTTILLGTLGLVLLFIYNKQNNWVLIFLSLFWLRFPFNALISIIDAVVNNSPPVSSDEAHIGYMLDISPWVPIVLTALLGTIVAVIVIFRFVAKPNRLHFILWSLIAAPISFIIWFYGLGKMLLPLQAL